MDTPHPYSDEEFIERYFDNELNDEEFSLFENRLESEPAFRKKFGEQKMIRQAAFGMVHKDRKKDEAGGELLIEQYFDNDLSDEEFEQFELRLRSDAVFNKNYLHSLNLRRAAFDLAHPGLLKAQSSTTKKADRKIWYAIAATLLILFVSGIYLTMGPEGVKEAGRLAELKDYEFDREAADTGSQQNGFEKLSDSEKEMAFNSDPRREQHLSAMAGSEGSLEMILPGKYKNVNYYFVKSGQSVVFKWDGTDSVVTFYIKKQNYDTLYLPHTTISGYTKTVYFNKAGRYYWWLQYDVDKMITGIIYVYD